MRNLIKKIISMALAFVIIASSAFPVSAAMSEESFAFEFPFKVAKEEKIIRLYKDGDELYIAHDSVPLLGEIEDHGDYFERSDGAAIILEDHNTVSFDGVVYHPFEDIMIGLCLNTMFYGKNSAANVDKDMVSLVPANNIFEVVYLGNKAMDYDALCLYGYTPEYFKDTSKPKTSVFTSMKNAVTDFLFSDIKQANSDFEDYNCYRTAIWDIMLPVNADLGWTSDYNNKLIDGAKEQTYYFDVAESTVKPITNQEYFFTEGLKRTAAIADIMSTDDFIDIAEFAHNITNIDQSIGNAFSIIQKLYVSKNENLKKAVNDTVDLYNGDQTPVDLYIDHVGMAGVNTTLDVLKGIAELPKALMLVADGYDLYGQQTYDASLKNTYNLAMGNLGVQTAAGDVFRQQLAGMKRLTDYKARAIRAKDMHDVLMVYLIAGHNAWQAVGDMNEFKDNKEQVIYDIEKKYLAELQKMSYVDFEVYLTAEDTKEKILDAAYRPYTNYTLSWNADQAEAVGGINVELDGKDSQGKGFTHEFNFSDFYKLNNGLTAGYVRTNENDNKGRSVTVYDFDGYCEIVVKPDTAGATVENIDLTIETGGNKFTKDDLAGYLVKDDSGATYYRIPLPIEATSAPDIKVASNQYLIDGDTADYLVTYDTEKFVLKDKNYGKGVAVTYTDEIKDELLYSAYNVDLGNEYKSFDEYYAFWKGIYRLDYAEDDEVQTLSHGQPVTVNIGGGLTAVYFDFECKSGKDPSGNIFINRYCFIDLGTGEYLSSHEFTAMESLNVMNISYNEYLQKLYSDIEIIS